jgi:membrane protease YdiL (CAAX protease family)
LTKRTIAGRRGAPVARGPVVAGAVISSLLFAVGHLPTMAILGELTPPVVVRTLVLNMAAGMLFARVFVRHSLVSATVCHAGFHLGVGVVALFSA